MEQKAQRNEADLSVSSAAGALLSIFRLVVVQRFKMTAGQGKYNSRILE